MGHVGACPQDNLRDIQRAFQELSNTRDAALVANCMGNMACINAAQAETITPDLLQETLYDAGFGDYGIGFGANATTKGAIWAEARRDARALSGIAAHCAAEDASCLGKAQAEGLANLMTLGAYDSAVALAGCAGGMTLDACRQTLVEAGVGVVSVGAGVVVAKVGGKLLRVTRKGDGFQAAAGGVVGRSTPDRRVELAELFNNSHPRNGIQIGYRTVLHDGTTGSARVFSGVSDTQVRSYFGDLTGQAIPSSPTRVLSDGREIYTVTTPDGNFNLRNFSSSGTGRWTIDIPAPAGGGTRRELKFE